VAFGRPLVVVMGIIAAAGAALAAPDALHDAFNAAAAYAYTKRIAGFGERWPGSPGHKQTEALVEQVVKKDGGLFGDDRFIASTPKGPIAVRNLIAKFHVTPDPSQPIVILAGHYDTLFTPGFIGANDGASSTAILLAFADALAAHPTKAQVWLLWTDLEEAITSFSGDDGLYGSRHFAGALKASGNASRVRGFFLLDMIGDKDLDVARESESSGALQNVMALAAADLGYQAHFFQYGIAIIDDHVPFIEAGIPAVDVVDARFGRVGPDTDGMGLYHHSNDDTLDKVSAASLGIVGRTMLRTIERLDTPR
jgi:glutaminyl-peptide cyclotransferase